MPILIEKKVIPEQVKFIVEFTEMEIFELVHRLKFQDSEHNVFPDLSAPTWQKLEKIIGNVKKRIDLY